MNEFYDQLEPVTAPEELDDTQGAVVLISIAVSLKRIADALSQGGIEDTAFYAGRAFENGRRSAS